MVLLLDGVEDLEDLVGGDGRRVVLAQAERREVPDFVPERRHARQESGGVDVAAQRREKREPESQAGSLRRNDHCVFVRELYVEGHRTTSTAPAKTLRTHKQRLVGASPPDLARPRARATPTGSGGQCRV